MGVVDGQLAMKQAIDDIRHDLHEELRAFIARRVQNGADAEDILQEVFLRIHRQLGSLRDPRRLVAWMFQITHHAIVDHFRAPGPAPRNACRPGEQS